MKKKLDKAAKKKEQERKKKEKEEGKASEVAPIPDSKPATGGAGLLMAPKASRTFHGTTAPQAPP